MGCSGGGSERKGEGEEEEDDLTRCRLTGAEGWVRIGMTSLHTWRSVGDTPFSVERIYVGGDLDMCGDQLCLTSSPRRLRNTVHAIQDRNEKPIYCCATKRTCIRRNTQRTQCEQ
jgi:hypothetical protein